MKILRSMKLAHKLPLLIVSTALVLTAVLIAVSTSNFRRGVLHNSEVFMQSLVQDRELALQSYFEGIEAAILTIASVPSTADAMKDLTATWSTRDGAGQAEVQNLSMFASAASPYDLHFERNHPAFQKVMERMGFYDIFLINPAGDVVFSVTKESDYATNMVSGPYRETGLAKAFRMAEAGEAGRVYFSDIEDYEPSAGAPAGFAATRIVDDAGRFAGVFALQVAIDEIALITTNFGGELKTLDVYLIGGDFRARTQSRLEGRHSVLEELPGLPYIEAAFSSSATAGSAPAAGDAQDVSFHPAVQKPDGSTVAAVTAPFTFRDLNWAIVAELDREEILAPAVRQRQIMLLISLSCAAAVSLLGWLFARSITRPVDKICRHMEAVAAGDLDTGIDAAARNDEIGKIGKTLVSMQADLKQARLAEEHRNELQQQQQFVVESLSAGLVRLSAGDFSQPITQAFPKDHEQLRHDYNLTLETLKETVQQVIVAAGSIRNGAEEISQASDDLSHRTESQAATLEETAAALDELTASVKSAAEGARSVEATMEEARAEAESSGSVVGNAVAAMTEIEQSSNHISQIISVIDDIAFQTNLLALNAGVEAARAGEAGKGFAVVASEVRALAQRSSDAAMEIKTLISDSSKQVERGVDLVGKAGEALQSIVERVTHISQLVSGIAEGAAEQSTGLAEINTGVTQLDQVTQQNAAMVEEATAAGHMLHTDSSKLAELVSHFTIEGQHAPRPDHQVIPKPSAHGTEAPDDFWNDEPGLPADGAAARPAATGTGGASKWEDF
ncbi:methyl-accepting chemotaxis protein [Leisingera caerulea]|uniref:Methyl-accepting chemotaxis protein n=1 Tax=Leisingera caerulea TaxID=506591 RepID=A0A9Q9LVY6_LEICA|nr:methyl-accepting chemotaxis protein [Leisingera caerulea]UWQ53060.1 methyl-accepting chemotaxis protein [Leisingera caerulea]